jgi:hypothetical protein
MAFKVAPKRRGKSVAGSKTSDSFVYRGVRIARTWKSSGRSKAIDDAMRKVIQLGPAQSPAG